MITEYINILENMKKAFAADDIETLFYLMCLLEQYLSDYRICDPNALSFQYLVDLRELIFLIAQTYFNKCDLFTGYQFKIQQLLSSLASLKLTYCISPKEDNNSFIPELKMAESLSHFGVYPQDFFAQASLLNKEMEQDICVIGIRSAGSYYAPAVCAALNIQSYCTVRPGVKNCENVRILVGTFPDIPLLLRSDELDDLKTSVQKSSCVILVDEGPGTGMTFRSIAQAISNFNPSCKIIIFHTRQLSYSVGSYSLGTEYEMIYVRPITFLNVSKRNLELALLNNIGVENNWQGSVEIDIVDKKSKYIKSPFSLKEHETPKALLTLSWKDEKSKSRVERKFVAKFLGYSSIGKERYEKLSKLKKFTAPNILYVDGVLVYEYVREELCQLNNFHIRMASEYFYDFYQISNVSKIPYTEYINKIEEICLEKIDDHTCLQNLISFLCLLRYSIGQEECFITEPDWKLEKNKWIFHSQNIYKFDNFHYKDYDDSPLADIFIHVAGFSIEFNLPQEQEIILLMELSRLLNKHCCEEMLFLNKLFYLIRKIDYYEYIYKNLKNYCYNFDALSSHLNRLIQEQRRLLESIPEI
jgi:hypothetical protein